MYNDKLDIKSPYIKKDVENLEDVRRRIAKRASSDSEETRNTLSLSNKSREESDNLLDSKIQKVSKRIVGEEIRKFAEIASTEISGEFEKLQKSLDKKIEDLEENLNNNLLLQNENLSVSEENIQEKINLKLSELNSVLEQMESRIKDLEVYSISEDKIEKEESEKREIHSEITEKDYTLNLSKNIKEEKEEVEIEEEEAEEKEEKKNERERELKEENEDENEEYDEDKEKAKLEENKEKYSDKCEKEEPEYDKKEKYVKEKIKKIVDKFERNGFLFKKNIFLSSLENLNAKDFLKDKKELEGVDEKDREKMLDILKDLVDDFDTEPKKDETIKHFLKRIYRKEYEKKN